ncbi:MAG: tRNA (adenosine(37)-N6)-threonylcarbamoyltransferase complex dimerization subunit type 1 TsaB [bacterium]
MLVLGIDASTRSLAVGLWNDKGLVGEMSGVAHLPHSERLLVHIMALLETSGRNLDELEGIGAVVGPGSYTGLRIGIGTAQGLAESRHLPTVGLSSLELLAYSAACAGQLVCPLIVARKGYVYAAVYEMRETGPVALQAPVVCQPEEVVRWIDRPVVFAGGGFVTHRDFFHAVLNERIIEAGKPSHSPSGRVVAYFAHRDLSAGKGCDPTVLQPEYLGPSTAEINWKQRQS